MRAFSKDAVRPEVRSLRAYDLAKEASGPLVAKLDFNESPYDVPAEIKEAVLANLKERLWSRYPEFGAPRLKAAIANAISRRPEEVVVGNGSGELLLAAISVFSGGGGGTLALAVPTFSLYGQMAAIAGARRVDVVRKGDEFAVDEAALLAACEDGRTVPLLCSPNNPTGGVVSLAFVKRLGERAPVVLLDQAYVDFARPENDALSLLDAVPNLVVFRTLSKAYSAAGFRIGYAAASVELARELGKAVLPFSVDHAAEELALALLERRAMFADTVAT
ncbi:MAG TPA: aminotransferase class I/II-fold pyridoxal phosphate-dependent enzyme, partial [Thermoanaerobaculia bacterium]|nr:aminotransferase class I/II-fold pyridoxal phosphate-dependent enzyme [Thermoanaerobaculia bacterium]